VNQASSLLLTYNLHNIYRVYGRFFKLINYKNQHIHFKGEAIMKRLIAKGTWLGLLAATLVLTACGGGGGGGGFTPPDINEEPIAITADTQNAIAQSIDGAIESTMGTGDAVDAVQGAVIDSGGSTPSVFDFASSKLLDYAKQGAEAATTANLPAGVMQSKTVPCDSGSITMTINVAAPESGMLIVDDSFSFTANNCKDNVDGTTINGSFSFTIDSGDLAFECEPSCPDTNVGVEISFNNFRIAESGGLTATIHGGFIMELDETSGTAGFRGTSLYLIAGADAMRLTNFDVSSTLISGDTATSSSVNMTIASTLIDGSITFATTVDIEQVIDQEHPYFGTVVMTGAGGATLRIEYADQYSVNFYFDPDGLGPDPEVSTLGVLWTDM
jgi:hypothetical protein